MPGLPDNKNLQVVPKEDEQLVQPRQPRQPQNLQGLLRYAMEAGGSQMNRGEVRELDEERKRFLDEVLKSMTVDVVALMKEQIEILQKDIQDNRVDDHLKAFETILEYVDNIDFANDFHKINGFSVFEPCGKSPSEKIREKAWELLAELSQNNPYIQNVICESTNLISKLLEALKSDPCESVRVKALYALSCIVRENQISYETFKRNKGLDHLKTTLSDSNDKVRLKTAFFIGSILRMDPTLPGELVQKGFLNNILEALKTDHQPSHEHLLDLLANILESEPRARSELKKQEENVKSLINELLDFARGHEEYQEEREYCLKILQIIERTS